MSTRHSQLGGVSARATAGSEAIANASQNQHQNSLTGTKTGLDETPAAHIRNALQILAGARRFELTLGTEYAYSSAEMRGIVRRLEKALAKLERPVSSGRCEITAEGRAALGVAAIDETLEQAGGA